MRECVSCGEPIPEDKRQDAKYCGKSKCRGREYRKRHPKPATAPKPHEHQTSTVLACPCGRRYLLAITELHADAATPAQAASLASQTVVTQTDERTEPSGSVEPDQHTGAITQTAPQTDAPAGLTSQQSEFTNLGNAAITQTVLQTEPSGSSTATAPETGNQPDKTAEAPQVAVSEPVATDDAPEAVTHADSATAQPVAAALTTLELTFCDANGRTLGFRDAVARNAAGDCSLRPNARPVFRGQERDPRCLGGAPGRWPRYYGGRSPTQFGFDADLVVMYWDPRERRGKAASAKVLQDILGDDWKEKLRQIRDERLRATTA